MSNPFRITSLKEEKPEPLFDVWLKQDNDDIILFIKNNLNGMTSAYLKIDNIGRVQLYKQAFSTIKTFTNNVGSSGFTPNNYPHVVLEPLDEFTKDNYET